MATRIYFTCCTALLWLWMVLDFRSTSGSNRIPVTRVKLHESTTLYCNTKCWGTTQWQRDREKVAECGLGAKTGFQFSCEVKEGESALTIPQVNYSTRGIYSAVCDEKTLFSCLQVLQPRPQESSLQLEAGEHLSVDLHIYEPVVLTLTRPENRSVIPFCTVDKRLPQCLPEYQKRVLLVDNSVVLLQMMPSDSASYSVQEKEGILVSVTNVTVTGKKRSNSKTESLQQRQNYSNIYFFINTLNDPKQSPLCKVEYQQGFWNGALCFGIPAFIVGILLQMYVFPQVLYQFHQGLRRLQRQDSTQGRVDMDNGELMNLGKET